MTKNLTQKVLNWTGGIAFTIANIFFTGGCYEEMTRYQATRAKTPRQAAAIHTFANIVGAEEQYQRDLNIAREGRSEVNVNVGYNNQFPVGKEGYMIITDLETGKKIVVDGLDDEQFARNYKDLYKGDFAINGYHEDGSTAFRKKYSPIKK